MGSGTFLGQQAIEKHYESEFATSPGKIVDKLIEVYPIGNEMSVVSELNCGPWRGYNTRIYRRALGEHALEWA